MKRLIEETSHMNPNLQPEDWRVISPSELLTYAKKTILDGRDPKDVEDWVKIASCIAINVEKGKKKEVLKKMASLIPIHVDLLMRIADYQTENAKKER